MVVLLALLASYSFSVPDMFCRVSVNHDQTLALFYRITFQCNTGADPVDVVDIGLPTLGWNTSDMRASLDGTGRPVMVSSYIDNGVEISLGAGIGPGETGVLEFHGMCSGGIYRDDDQDDWASFRFSPTWFDGSLLTGNTHLVLEIVFPQGSSPDSVRYHEEPFDTSWVDKGRVVYRWDRSVRLDRSFEVGIGFPAGLVSGSLAVRPSEPLFDPACCAPIAIFLVLFLFIALPVFFGIRSSIIRQKQYLPPKIRVGGKGVRRGLTVPMAALLMEKPLDRVVMLMVWSLIKKGAVTVTGEGAGTRITPMGLVPEGLRDYEKKLLELIAGEEGLTTKNLETFFKGMISDLETAMEGFNLKTTREYYTGVMKNAWKQLEEAPDAVAAAEVFADRFQWLLASEDKPQQRLSRLPVPVFIPMSSWPVSTGGTGQSINVAAACGNLVSRIESAAGSSVRGLTRSVAAIVNPVPVSRSSGSRSGGGCACACACAGCACACAGGGR
ncbi:MAG: hypothetical protein R6V62_10525 [Candidatus Fermentibacteraceae bacterium]